MDDTCPMCSEGKMREVVGDDSIVINGDTYSVRDFYSVCSECGVELANDYQSKMNAGEVLAARKKAELRGI